MSQLNWGEPDLQTATSTNGAPAGEWKDLPNPKEDTLKLTANAGTDKTATEEGGAIVDYMPGKTTYTLEWDEFVKKGEEPAFDDVDGVIAGEHAFRVSAQDKDCPAIQIDRAVLRVEESYSTADGSLRHYVATVLKPATGSSVKRYVPGTANVTPPAGGGK